MSGRSAYVRAKNTEQADKRAHRAYSDYGHGKEEQFIYGYPGAPMSIPRPTFSADPSHVSSPRPRRRQSISSAGSTYGYPPPSMRKPHNGIIQSQIEKSDFRTHLDGMSASLRGKLGRLMKGGDDHTPLGRRRPVPVGVSSDTESHSTDFTPSINAVPSLTASTSPSEGQSTLSSFGAPTSHAIRSKTQQESVLHKIRRFEGSGKLPQLGWKSLTNTPELWDEHGDTFVYMYMQGSRTKPPPSFRIDSSVIVQAGSKAFIDQLRHPDEPEGWPRFYPYEPHNSIPLGDPSESFTNYANDMTLHDEEDDIDAIRLIDDPRRYTTKAPRGIQHELYIPWPGAETGIHSTIWHITTRNFFAVMYDANALVGTTLHEAMFKLFERINMYPDYLDRNISKVAWLTDYIVRHKFDDVRNNPSYAASLLAFSESPGVQWREGYIEAFVHCVGMANLGLQTIPEWRYITPNTKIFIQNASMEIEERIHRAQIWLLSFDFSRMWPASNAPPTSARQCFDRLRKWLCKYYENAFLHWPPTNDQTWLTRDMVLRLKADFHGLYDYMVDRDVMFDGSEYRPGQKWVIASASGQPFRADTPELPITDILANFDIENNFPHIPHPYPICPLSIPPQAKPKSSFTLKKPTSANEILAQSRRKAISYSEATNVYILREHYVYTDLVSNFIQFEQGDMIEAVDPYEARRGRWILIYGILQVLATISVDSPNLRYIDGAQYHLNPQMKGIVPWREPGAPREEEASHMRSHCWTIPATWAPSAPKARPGAHKPILWGQFGDGRTRAEGTDQERIDRDRTERDRTERDRTERDRITTPPTDRIATPTRSPEYSSIGRKRAEEWVATSAGQQMDMGGDGGITTVVETVVETEAIGDGSPLHGRNNSYGTGGTGSGGAEYSMDGAREAARKRRAERHGFTDFRPPFEWADGPQPKSKDPELGPSPTSST